MDLLTWPSARRMAKVFAASDPGLCIFFAIRNSKSDLRLIARFRSPGLVMYLIPIRTKRVIDSDERLTMGDFNGDGVSDVAVRRP